MMEPIELLGPSKQIMDLYLKYLDKCKNLDKKERNIYCDFFIMLQNPSIVIEEGKIHIDDLVNSNRPGAIVRRRS